MQGCPENIQSLQNSVGSAGWGTGGCSPLELRLFDLRFGCTRPWLSCSAADIGFALGREVGPAAIQTTFLCLCNDRFSWPLGSEGRGAQGVLPALFFLIEHSQHISVENFLETALSSMIALLLPCHQITEASRYRSFLDEKQLHLPFGVSYFKKCWPDIICRLWSRNC